MLSQTGSIMSQRAKTAPSREHRIAFVQSNWHHEIVDAGRRAFIAEMKKLGFERRQLDFFNVPGAFEIPLHAKLLARSNRYSAVVACGLVVDGGIYRHEFVADAVIKALMQVQLETEIPVFSAVLTPHHFHEHTEHASFFRRHFLVKGAEAAQACARTLQSLESIREAV
jgi:6,7-dimethyl-8-ribityllumazine synthase